MNYYLYRWYGYHSQSWVVNMAARVYPHRSHRSLALTHQHPNGTGSAQSGLETGDMVKIGGKMVERICDRI